MCNGNCLSQSTCFVIGAFATIILVATKGTETIVAGIIAVLALGATIYLNTTNKCEHK